jgi:hypothetical protein
MAFPRCSILALTALLFAGAAHSQQPAFDILGLRLGMTEGEAVAAIKARNSALKITSVKSAFGYSDGVEQFQTEPFLSRVEARSVPTSIKADLVLYFTPPPQGGRVWAIERDERIEGDPPTVEQYAAALKQKYGTPTAVSPGGAHLAWDFPAGRPNCIPRPPDRPGFPAFRPSGSDDLGFLLNLWQQRKLAPADLSTCASRLHYVLSSNGPVVASFYASLIDVPAFAASNAAANREVDALEERARKARESKGRTPAL